MDIEQVIKAKVVERAVSYAGHKTVAVICRGSDTVGDLKQRLRQVLPRSVYPLTMHAAFKGMLLRDNQQRLSEFGMIDSSGSNDSHPTVFLTFAEISIDDPEPESEKHEEENKQESKMDESANVPSAAEESSSQTRRIPHPISDENEEKMCRLCFSSDEDLTLGRLFSPCRCSGTMKYIHSACLNEWRAHAPRERSQFVCDQCGYEYNISRAQWAGVVEDPRLSYAVTAVILFFAVIVAGVFTTLVQDVFIWSDRLRLDENVYRAIEWNPVLYFSTRKCRSPACDELCNSWNVFAPECPRACGCSADLRSLPDWFQLFLTVVFNGILVIAVVGLYVAREEWWRGRTLFLFTLLQNTRTIRLLLAVGIGHSFLQVFELVRRYVKQILYKFGEQILEVDSS